MQSPVVSLIISFYNNTNYLKLVLAGLERQSFKSFEVLIADDGSNEENIKTLKKLIEKSSFKIIHVWHEDKGWRKTTILNKAVVKSNTDYLIFIDGDCIPHSRFIEKHYQYREKNVALNGRRVNLSPKVSRILTPEKVRKGLLERRYLFLLFIHRLFGKGSHIENGIYFNSAFIVKKIRKKKNKGILGSNFSIHKEDLLKVNGFDERYINPAVGEDSDLRYRLVENGTIMKTMKHISIQYHMHHKQLVRSEENMKIFNETQEKRIIFTPFGINK